MARANLEAKLSADTSVFTRAMAAAQASAARFATDAANRTGAVGAALDRVAKISRGVQAQFAAAVSAGSLINLVNQLDDIGDAAANLEVSPRFLDALGQAARLTGTDAQTATTAMQKLLQVIGDARRGEGTAFQTLSGLGIDITQLRDNEAAVFAIAEALGKLKTNAERASFQADLLGRQGKKMTELFAEGEDGLRRWIARVEEAGLVSSELAIATSGTLSDAFGSFLKRVNVGGGETIATISGLAEGVKAWGKAFVDAEEGTGFFAERLERTKTAATSFQGLLDALKDSLGDFTRAQNAGRDAVVDFYDSAEKARRSAEGDVSAPSPGFRVQPSGAFGAPFLFGGPFAQEGFAELLERARFAIASQTFRGIPLGGAGQGALEVWEAQRRLENELVESKGRRAEREGNPPPGGSIRLDTDTQLMLQELRRNSKQLEKIEQNTAPLRE